MQADRDQTLSRQVQLLRTAAIVALCCFSVSLLAACSEVHSSLSPAGPQAASIATLTWIFIVVCGAIWAGVMVALAVAVWRDHGTRADPLAKSVPRERHAHTIIGAAVAGTAAVVIALTIVSFYAQRQLFADTEAPLAVQVTGHQWWWEVQYRSSEPYRQFLSANEIYIPVGSAVRLHLKTADVIHSFWIPSLAGKMDQITGQENELRLSASRAGVYRGQCAEFCGVQHAHMALFVVALPQNDYEAWHDAQLRPALAPADAVRQQGMRAFFAGGCMLCHTIRGTDAGGNLGPDLTHFASRKTIAAGTLPNTAANLGGWIADPQHLKPGTQMPAMKLSGPELSSLVAYLEGLR
jgi:cytochrome c oxidase subunit II